MAIKVVTTFICDMCHKEFQDDKEISQVNIPGFDSGYGEHDYETICRPIRRELCNSCFNKICYILKENGIYFENSPSGYNDKIDEKYLYKNEVT